MSGIHPEPNQSEQEATTAWHIRPDSRPAWPYYSTPPSIRQPAESSPNLLFWTSLLYYPMPSGLQGSGVNTVDTWKITTYDNESHHL